MTIAIRIAGPHHVPILNAIRTSVRENHMSLEEMAAYGITSESIAELLTTTGRGFIASLDGTDAGISIADRAEGNIFALFVRPTCEGRGLGSRLLAEAERFLFDGGLDAIWLEAGAADGLRAHGFYRRHGWREDGRMPDSQLRFVKARPAEVAGAAP